MEGASFVCKQIKVVPGEKRRISVVFFTFFHDFSYQLVRVRLYKMMRNILIF